MNAVFLGLIAAICWALHDITIRYLSRSVPLMAALAIVAMAGLAFQTVVFGVTTPSNPFAGQAIGLSIAAGLMFLLASLGLYYAFERGPVRLVSPIIGAYPIATVILATLGGTNLSLGQITAVGCIVIGVGLVAILSDTTHDKTPAKGPTIVLSTLSALGFAGTFELGQLAAKIDGEMASTMILRITMLVSLIIIMIWKRAPLMMNGDAIWKLILMGTLDGVAVLAIMSASHMPLPQLATVTGSIFGLFTIVMAWAFLRETMTALQWLGCFVSFAAIGYLAW